MSRAHWCATRRVERDAAGLHVRGREARLRARPPHGAREARPSHRHANRWRGLYDSMKALTEPEGPPAALFPRGRAARRRPRGATPPFSTRPPAAAHVKWRCAAPGLLLSPPAAAHAKWRRAAPGLLLPPRQCSRARRSARRRCPRARRSATTRRGHTDGPPLGTAPSRRARQVTSRGAGLAASAAALPSGAPLGEDSTNRSSRTPPAVCTARGRDGHNRAAPTEGRRRRDRSRERQQPRGTRQRAQCNTRRLGEPFLRAIAIGSRRAPPRHRTRCESSARSVIAMRIAFDASASAHASGPQLISCDRTRDSALTQLVSPRARCTRLTTRTR